MSKIMLSATLGAALLFASGSALADSSDDDGRALPGARAVDGDDDSYGYEFPDDPLDAGVSGANGSVIKIRQKIVRRTLIRPRTHFVPELFKSIELI